MSTEIEEVDTKKTDEFLSNFIEYCNTNFHVKNDESSSFLNYLTGRGFTKKTIDKFHLGYCPSNGIIPDEVLNFSKDDYPPKYIRSKLSDRIIVPIFDEFKKAVGLASRPIDSGGVWWNMPSPFFKSHHLFLLHIAKKYAYLKNKMYVFEGYADSLMLHQYGLSNSVSAMCSRLSARQIGLMSRYCDNICLCFDTDKNQSGQKGMKRSIALINEYKFYNSISVIHLPEGVDPDNFVIQHSLDDFLKLEEELSNKQIVAICREVKEGLDNDKGK
jgi:DNA primase